MENIGKYKIAFMNQQLVYNKNLYQFTDCELVTVGIDLFQETVNWQNIGMSMI